MEKGSSEFIERMHDDLGKKQEKVSSKFLEVSPEGIPK